MTSTVAPSRITVRRLAQRGSNDRAVVDAILDEALVCHVGFATPDGPVVLPTLFVRVGDEIAFHGAPGNAMLRAIGRRSVPACCTVTLIDGLVLARSAFHHSVNYRSAVVFGRCRIVTERSEKLALFEALVDKVMPGRYAEARQPTEEETRATLVVAMSIDEASAKVRTGGPLDDEEDYALPVWAGQIPMAVVTGEPLPDDRLADGARPPVLVDGSWHSAPRAAAVS